MPELLRFFFLFFRIYFWARRLKVLPRAQFLIHDVFNDYVIPYALSWGGVIDFPTRRVGESSTSR
jgi:hypothetical protein